MKKRAIILAFVAVMLAVVPAAAGRGVLEGDRLIVFPGGGTIVTPAEEAFHILQGFGGVPVGMADFDLYLDGAPVTPDFRRIESAKGGAAIVRWAFNFPGGMTGVHSFTGYWRLRCRYAVANDWIEGPCASPNAIVTVLSWTEVVTFTE